MELVYLWVEKYKNIYHQGFNFSPRFRCKFYDEYEKYTDENGEEKERLKDNCELVICDKEEDKCLDKETKKCKSCKDNGYIKDFFGEDINVTAIVGKNGSGKSSVFEILEQINKNSFNRNYILILDNGRYLANFEFNREKAPYLKKKINSDDIEINIYKNYSFNQKFETLLSKDNTFFNFINKNFFFTHKYYTIHKNLTGDTIELEKNLANMCLNILYRYLTPGTEIRNIKPISNPFKTTNKTYQKFEKKIKKDNMDYNSFIKELIDTFKKEQPKIKQELTELNYVIEESKYHKNSINDIINRYIVTKKDLDDFYQNFQYDKTSQQWKTKNKKFTIKEIEYTLIKKVNNMNELNLFNESYKGLKKIELKTNYLNPSFPQYSYEKLSTGEKDLINLLTYCYDTDEKIILFDEPDNSLHPLWKKEFISHLATTYKKLGYNSHIIFTTHSPFLLSDIPKQNIIFLDTDENGKCKVVDGLNDKKETFGANIHTLLSDSFFMEDGLMGEFAKGKIESIRKFYNKVIKYKDNNKVKKAYKCFYKKKQKEFWDIQSIIGEPFLQKIVKNQLEEIELILLGKNDAIDKEIARLQVLKESFNNDQY